MKQFYVFVNPPKNVQVFNEVLAKYYASNKVGIIKAETDVEAVFKFIEGRRNSLSLTEMQQLEARITCNPLDISDVSTLVYQTYVDNGNVY